MFEIAAQSLGRANFHRRSVHDWAFDDDLPQWSTTLEADFVVTALFKDTRETTGRVVGGLIIGAHTYWKQVGAACALDLRSAHMVWCHTAVDRWGDLRDPAIARAAAYDLLSDMTGPTSDDGAAPPSRQSMRKPGASEEQ